MPGVTLDAGALIAIEKADRRMQALLDEAHAAGLSIDIPAGVFANAGRSRRGQARPASTLHLANVTVRALDEPRAKAAGILCGHSGTTDPIAASVVLNARQRDHTVITSDPTDLRRLDSHLRITVL